MGVEYLFGWDVLVLVEDDFVGGVVYFLGGIRIGMFVVIGEDCVGGCYVDDGYFGGVDG